MSSTFLDERRPHVTVTLPPASNPPASPLLRRFGGPNAVIVADVYADPHSRQSVLYLVDTVAIPARFHLQALPASCADDEDRRTPALLGALCAVAAGSIAAGSFLVLGPRLQYAVADPAALLGCLRAAGLAVRSLVAFDELKRLDAGQQRFDVTDNFDEMSRRPLGVANVACRLAAACAPQRPLAVLQRLLDVANALSDQRAWHDDDVDVDVDADVDDMLDVSTAVTATGGQQLPAGIPDRVRWWLLSVVYSAL